MGIHRKFSDPSTALCRCRDGVQVKHCQGGSCGLYQEPAPLGSWSAEEAMKIEMLEVTRCDKVMRLPVWDGNSSKLWCSCFGRSPEKIVLIRQMELDESRVGAQSTVFAEEKRKLKIHMVSNLSPEQHKQRRKKRNDGTGKIPGPYFVLQVDMDSNKRRVKSRKNHVARREHRKRQTEHR